MNPGNRRLSERTKAKEPESSPRQKLSCVTTGAHQKGKPEYSTGVKTTITTTVKIDNQFVMQITFVPTRTPHTRTLTKHTQFIHLTRRTEITVQQQWSASTKKEVEFSVIVSLFANRDGELYNWEHAFSKNCLFKRCFLLTYQRQLIKTFTSGEFLKGTSRMKYVLSKMVGLSPAGQKYQNKNHKSSFVSKAPLVLLSSQNPNRVSNGQQDSRQKTHKLLGGREHSK